MKRALAALATVGLLAGCVTSPDKLQSPSEGWGTTYLLVIDLAEGRAHPEKVYYPPECGEEGAICLGASMMVHRGQRVATLASSNGMEFPRGGVEIQKPGGHARMSAPGGRFVVIAEETADGYWWVPWANEASNRRACVPNFIIEQFSLDVPQNRLSGGEFCYRFAG